MMRSCLLRFTLTLAAAILPCSNHALAQSFVVPKVIVEGVPAYSQDDLLSIIHLTPGSTATAADVQAAAQRLSDTGLFTDIHFESNQKGLVFLLKPMPSDNLLPARFANFVWFTTQELDTTLRQQVKLYQGLIPMAGTMQDQIIAALTHMVASKGVTATVTATPMASPAGGTPTSVMFSIDTPAVRIHNIHVGGASEEFATALQSLAQHYRGTLLQESLADAVTASIRSLYRNAGHLDVTLAPITLTPLQQQGDAIEVDLATEVTEGPAYRVGAITWATTPVLTADDFARRCHLKTADVDSEAGLHQCADVVAAMYGAFGYLDAKVNTQETLDHSSHLASYVLSVTPGEAYRLRNLSVRGLSSAQKSTFDAAWTLHPGDVYNRVYVETFLMHDAHLQAVLGSKADYKTSADATAHVVDLVVDFSRPASGQ